VKTSLHISTDVLRSSWSFRLTKIVMGSMEVRIDTLLQFATARTFVASVDFSGTGRGNADQVIATEHEGLLSTHEVRQIGYGCFSGAVVTDDSVSRCAAFLPERLARFSSALRRLSLSRWRFAYVFRCLAISHFLPHREQTCGTEGSVAANHRIAVRIDLRPRDPPPTALETCG
jgi:hypothetical protein